MTKKLEKGNKTYPTNKKLTHHICMYTSYIYIYKTYILYLTIEGS